jgi:hypothetical protein
MHSVLARGVRSREPITLYAFGSAINPRSSAKRAVSIARWFRPGSSFWRIGSLQALCSKYPGSLRQCVQMKRPARSRVWLPAGKNAMAWSVQPQGSSPSRDAVNTQRSCPGT